MATRKTDLGGVGGPANGSGRIPLAGSPPTPEGCGWSTWPGGAAAAKRLCLSMQRLNRMVRDGDLVAYTAPDGSRRFRPEELDALAIELRSVELEDEAAVPNGPTGDHVRAVTEALKNAVKHAENAFGLVTSPALKFQEAQQQLTDRLLKRVGDLEAAHDELIRARERYLTEQEERRIMAEEFAAREARRTEVMRIITGHGPDLMSAITQRLGGSSRVAAVGKLLESLDPEFVRGLLDEDVLNAEQQEHLRAALGEDGLARLGLDKDGRPLAPEGAEKETS